MTKRIQNTNTAFVLSAYCGPLQHFVAGSRITSAPDSALKEDVGDFEQKNTSAVSSELDGFVVIFGNLGF